MTTNLNGIDVAALQQLVQGVASDVSKRDARFNVKTRWEHQTRSVATVSRYVLGGETHKRHFEIVADEPAELLGANSAPVFNLTSTWDGMLLRNADARPITLRAIMASRHG